MWIASTFFLRTPIDINGNWGCTDPFCMFDLLAQYFEKRKNYTDCDSPHRSTSETHLRKAHLGNRNIPGGLQTPYQLI